VSAIISELRKHGFRTQVNIVKTPLLTFLSSGRKGKLFPFKILKERLTIDISYRIIAMRE
jgi:hypothetical protein